MDFFEGHTPTTEEIEERTKLTAETLKNLQTLEIEVQGELQQTLDSLNLALGTSMQPRTDGYHLTIISPPESGKLATLTLDQIEDLQRINSALQKGEGVTIMGVGYIDGTTAPNIRAADKAKRTSYLAIDIPALRRIREELGLPEKDFHITLGFEGGDIHMEIIGRDGKGKDVLGPIPKKANSELARFTPQKIAFGPISGQPRQSAPKAS